MARNQLDCEFEEITLVEAAESSVTLANKASPDIAACMWAALKSAMAYCVRRLV
jgi:hypothetical protein